MRTRQFTRILCLLGLVTTGFAADEEPKPVSYYKDIRPVFQANCVGCHQPSKDSGGYVMTDFVALLGGGEDGVAIIPGNADESHLVKEITPGDDGKAEMPKKKDPLHHLELTLVKKWIAEGAIDDTPANARQRYDQDHPPVYTKPPVITSLDYSPDGTLLAVAGFHEVLLHKADGSGLVARLVGLSERIESVRFSPDGKRLAVTGGLPGRMGEVQVWDVEKHKLKLSAPVTFDTVYGAAWSPDGTKISFGCSDNTLRAIDSKSGEQVLFQGGHNDWVFDTAFNPKGDHVVSVSRDMTAKLTELATQRFIDNITSITPNALKGGIQALVMHPTRDEIVVGGSDGVPKLYRIFRNTDRKIGDDANLLFEFPPLEGRVFAVDISNDAKRIAAGSSLDGRGAIHIYEVDPGAEIPNEIAEIIKKPTHERNDDMRNKLEKYFADGVQTLAAIPVSEAGIYAVSFNPDGSRLAAAGADGKVRILDASNGGEVKSFLPVEIATTAEVAGGEAAGDTIDKRPPLDAEKIPDGRSVVKLSIVPAGDLKFELDRFRYAQVVVSAELDSGDIIDVTRLAEKKVTGIVASVSNTGVISPVADGLGGVSFSLAGKTVSVPISVAGMAAEVHPEWSKDVNPVIARMGCNMGTCHGSKDGKNGFKLSLRGYDPIYDVRAFTDDIASRRVNLASPDDSLMLLKATGAVPHEGGQRTTQEADYYKVVRSWIADGAKLEEQKVKAERIDVFPLNPVVQNIGAMQQMRVVATYPGGETRDVTAEAFVESGNGEVAEAVEGYPALVKVLRRGEAPILVRYEGAYAATTVTAMGDRSGFEWTAPPKFTAIDGFVADKWQRMKTLPSEICTDTDFVRRAYLDLTGLPPTTEQVKAFLADVSHSQVKRDALIDSLIGSPEFVEFWTNKWADMLQVNRKFLAPEGAKLFRDWIRKEVAANTPYDQFAHKIITASGSNKVNPPASYFKILREPAETMENTTHLFLATRFNCNKCHDHPFERWTQDNYYEMSAFFAQVGLKGDPDTDKKIGGTAVEGATPLYEIIYDKQDGEMKHERTGEITAPAFPYETAHTETKDAARRDRLAAWITSPDNRYFASSYANRIWGYMLGTGIIEPLDDIRAGNPPSNPELLDYLTKYFVESGFDTRELMRHICKSRTYQLSIKTNDWNEDDTINFSHAKARRLPAEVLYDSIHAVTGASSKFPGVPKGTRAASLPDVGVELPDSFLANFGRPVRESSCECERNSDMQLGPIMALLSGPTVGDAIADPGNAVTKLANEVDDDRQLVEALFYRILNRPPAEAEIAASLEVFNSAIDQDHATLQSALAKHLGERDPSIDAAEKKRESDIDAARAAAVEHEKAIQPQVDEKEMQRQQRVAQLEADKQAYEASLPEKIAAWEQGLSAAGKDIWTPLAPADLKASNGATLTLEADNAVIATGSNGKGDYTFTAATELGGITAIRLETLTDERIAGKGPGRGNGNFVLGEIMLESAPESDPTKFAKVKFGSARADFSQQGYEVAKAIDGIPGGSGAGWAIAPQQGKNHTALFTIEQPVVHEGGALLRFKMIQPFDDAHTIGKFRISVTTLKGPLPFSLPENIQKALAVAGDKRDAKHYADLSQYIRDNDAEWKTLGEQLADASKPLPIDPKLKELREGLVALEKSPRADPAHDNLRHDLDLSTQQLSQRRLTGAQDLTWALINTPAFLFNH